MSYTQTNNLSPVETANIWLETLNDAIRKSDATAFADCIAEDGWIRDLLVFTPDLTSRRGREPIATYLKDKLARARISELRLDNSPSGKVFESKYAPGIQVVEGALDFETPWAICKGYVRILQSTADGETPKALTLMLSISDWKGFEEEQNMTSSVLTAGLYGSITTQRKEIEESPEVLIVGAAQCGLQVAARLRHMGIKALIIEKTPRIGDIWRERYPTLKLNTKRWWHTFLYEPYDAGWPLYTPKDKLADWMESYADKQSLVVWTNTIFSSKSIYDESTGRWTVTVKRSGEPITLHPKHIVMATSFYGEPSKPFISGSDTFPGRFIHSNEFPGGEPFSGRRVLVVGAGLSSSDITEDLVRKGAKEVTMVQRSPVYVVLADEYAESNDEDYCENRDLYYNDLRYANFPLGAIRQRDVLQRDAIAEANKKIHDGLEAAGFKVSKGYENDDAAGVGTLALLRRGGYIVDKGWSQLVIDGKIKIKSDSMIDHFAGNSVIFEDGTSLEVDDIILSTGFKSNKDTLIQLFGEEVISKVDGVWGYDENDESRFGYKLSGQPGLWFAVGDFAFPRFYSKHLALLMKGIELCYVPYTKGCVYGVPQS